MLIHALVGISVELYHISYTPYYGLSADTITHMGYAVSQWNSAAGSTKLKVSINRHLNTAYPNKDGINEIYKMNTGNSNYVAQTTTWYTS